MVNNSSFLVGWLIHFSGIKCNAAPDRNPKLGYNTVLFQLIPGDLYCACPYRQLNSLPVLFHSRAKQGISFYNFYDGLRYDPVEAQTHDLLHERQIP